MNRTGPSRWRGVIDRCAVFLPVSEKTPVVTLCEGDTPLIPTSGFVKAIGGNFRLLLKFEMLGSTASFEDRGMSLAISKACEKENRPGRTGLECLVILPENNIDMEKLSQALIHGARTIAVRGNFDDAIRLVRQPGERRGAEIVNRVNPVRIEGPKTAAFEICDILDRAPDHHFLPVGNAGNITAYRRGFREYRDRGIVEGFPRRPDPPPALPGARRRPPGTDPGQVPSPIGRRSTDSSGAPPETTCGYPDWRPSATGSPPGSPGSSSTSDPPS